MQIKTMEKLGVLRRKRKLDVGMILITLPLLLPLMIAIGLIIRMTSNGPVLFQQERVGYRGKKFMCIKFRTMFCGAEPISHQNHLQQLVNSESPMTKMDALGDARIVPMGRLLRAAGLDELPQLINVFKGEMSLVGPRPCLPYEAENYHSWQWERFNAVPGLTGLWQISGKNRTTFKRMMELDIEYAKNQSLLLDLKIIFKTIPVLLSQILDVRKRTKKTSSPAVTTGTVMTETPMH